ncbi:MAG: phosphate acyltransferase [Verrucomicrobiales bacterium]
MFDLQASFQPPYGSNRRATTGLGCGNENLAAARTASGGGRQPDAGKETGATFRAYRAFSERESCKLRTSRGHSRAGCGWTAINQSPSARLRPNRARSTYSRLGELGTPKVAILSATERITEDIPATVEAAALCKMADRGLIDGVILDGPLAFDNAISKEAARTKGIRSEVSGDVDILIVPDLQSGNMLYKQMKFLSGYNAAGLVMGARVPIILTSRSSGTQARLASAALALLYANRRMTDD